MNTARDPAPMSATQPSEPQRWQLHIHHVQGSPLHVMWTWPDETRQIGLDKVLAPFFESAPDWLTEAAKILLHRASPISRELEVCSAQLLCTHNAVPLQSGQRVALQHADLLELGMCRLEVLEPGNGRQDEGPAMAFDWNDLIERHAGVAPPSDPAQAAGDLRHLLQDALQDAQPGTEQEKKPSAQPAGWPASRSALPQAPLQTHHDEAVPALPDAADEDLQRLHAQYLRRLSDPLSTADLLPWQGIRTRQQGQSQDPFQELVDKSLQGPEMAELLGQSAHINSVLARLDPVGGQNILQPERFESVMHLFAPPSLREGSIQHQVPSLNRLEHHGMTLDSDMTKAPRHVQHSPVHTPAQPIDRPEHD
jgi:hypothetical protein